MSEMEQNNNQVSLKVMRCPTCGGDLKVDRNRPDEPLECIYCGNTVVPVTQKEAPDPTPKDTLYVKLDTSSSALAYVRDLFEGYDWDSFFRTPEFTVEAADYLVHQQKLIAANDPGTWELAFLAAREPFVQKQNACMRTLDKLVSCYAKDDPDVYSMFDTYRRVATALAAKKTGLLQELSDYAAKAGTYGADQSHISSLNAELEALRSAALPTLWKTLEQVPQIEQIIHQRTAQVTARLAAQGLNAAEEYARAKALIEQQRFVPALSTLLTLEGYLDCNRLAEELNRFYLIDQALEVCGRLYYYQLQKDEYYSIFEIQHKVIQERPLITDIRSIITNFADLLYYVDRDDRLCMYDLGQKGKRVVLSKKAISTESILTYEKGHRAYLLMPGKDEYSENCDLTELDLVTGNFRTIYQNVRKLLGLKDGKLVFSAWVQDDKKTMVLNIPQNTITLLAPKAKVLGFADNSIVYGIKTPTDRNWTLWCKPMSHEPAILIEENIYQFSTVADGMLYYLVGNSRDSTLIRCAPGGSNRREVPIRISELLFEKGGWLYYIFRSGYNAALCRARPNGTERKVIGSGIARFEKSAGGYLHYVDTDDSLIRVRMDGSGKQTLCRRVHSILHIEDERIIFLSRDDQVIAHENDDGGRRALSVYEVPFDGSGKRKLLYDVKQAKPHGDDSIFFISQEDWLKRLELADHTIEDLFQLEEIPQRSGCLVPICILCFFLFLTLMGLTSYTPSLIGVGLIGALISGVVALSIHAGKS